MAAKKVPSPLMAEAIGSLKIGDEVEISGVVYTARDQAHRLLFSSMEKGETLPFDLAGQTLFYAGPAETPPGRPIGSIGPTTAQRMDPYTPKLLELGLKGMIGKGYRSPEVVDAIRKYGAVYLVATGGAAAYLSTFVRKAEIVAYPELGPEAVYRLEIADFPVVVAIDSDGRNLFEQEWSKYRLG